MQATRAERTPEEIATSLRAFEKTAQVFSSDSPRLIDLYPDQWVAVYNGKVVTHDRDVDVVFAWLEEHDIPLGDTMTRFIDTAPRVMIL